MDATWGRDELGSKWDAAVDLADHVVRGHPLPLVPSPVLLDGGEVSHTDLAAYGWRFHGADVAYVEPRVLALGRPVLFALTALTTAAARRRARADAERLAAPQWRPLGHLRILATDRRLLVLHQGSWASVWYAAIREIHPTVPKQRLEISFEDDPPYALAGPWVPYLTVVITAALVERLGVDAVSSALGVRT